MPRRDSERSRHYAMERFIALITNGDAVPPVSLDEARRMADEICDETDGSGIARIPVHGRPPKSAAAFAAYPDREMSSVRMLASDGREYAVRVELPEWARRPLYITHQVAHYVTFIRGGSDSVPGFGTEHLEEPDDEPDGCRYVLRADGGWEYAYPPPPGLDGKRPLPTRPAEAGGND